MKTWVALLITITGLSAFAGEYDRLKLKPSLDLSSVPQTPQEWKAVIKKTKRDAKQRAEVGIKALPAAERSPARRLVDLYVNVLLPNSGMTPIAATIEGRNRLREWSKAAAPSA